MKNYIVQIYRQTRNFGFDTDRERITASSFDEARELAISSFGLRACDGIAGIEEEGEKERAAARHLSDDGKARLLFSVGDWNVNRPTLNLGYIVCSEDQLDAELQRLADDQQRPVSAIPLPRNGYTFQCEPKAAL